MKDALARQFKTLISHTLGLQVREQDQQLLWHKISTRTAALGFPNREAYYHFLTSNSNSAQQATEWQELACLLTVNESYFLRDQGQFSLLRNKLLPDLIQRKRESQFLTLRFWSAGCSTGEEAYSLAVLLKELLPDLPQWTILIWGTDINSTAIARAKQGRYSDWSFRLVSPAFKQRYFSHHQEQWEVIPEIRQMVTFQVGNLVQDRYPNTNMANVDLILCRNVFIYFEEAAIATVLHKFHQTLAATGYLLTGHTELQGHSLHQFRVLSFPESTVYQPAQETTALPLVYSSHPGNETDKAPAVSHPTPVPGYTREIVPNRSAAQLDGLEAQKQTLLQTIETLFTQKAYSSLIQQAQELLKLDPKHLKAHCLLAETYANLGDYSKAAQLCQQALQFHPLSIEPCYLLAQVLEEQDNLQQALQVLKRVIYLAPDSIQAYLELGSLYERQGNLPKAMKQWQAALQFLNRLPPDTSIHWHRPFTVQDLQAHLEQILQNYG